MPGKIFSMGKRSNGQKSGSQVFRLTGYLLDHERGLYVEDYFNELLRIERKRTERSLKPFMLMLINISAFRSDDEREEIADGVAETLLTSTRETDVKGWYKHDHAIGVLFTEINGAERNPVAVKTEMLHKIERHLSDALGAAASRRIKITCHLFPEHEARGVAASPDTSLYPDLTKKGNPVKRFSLLLKRVIDIIGSSFLLAALFPLLLLIALLVKVSSKGPVLYRQERVGLFGKRFTFLKFRSMCADNDPRIHQKYVEELITGANGGGGNGGGQDGVFKIKDDPRVTPVGRFLRRTSLDELPQLINVLKGEMSLVGPRPPIPYEVEHYDIWHKRRLLEIKPGITGLWQVKGRSSTTFDEMVRLDLKYTTEWSLLLDLKILLATPLAVFSGKGAY